MAGRRRCEEADNEEEQQSQNGGGVDGGDETEDESPPVRPRARRAAAASSSYRDRDEDDDDDDDDGDDDGVGRGRGAKRRKGAASSSSAKPRAAPKKSGSSLTQSYCSSQVETQFTFNQEGLEAFVARSQESQETIRPQEMKTYDNLSANEKKSLVSDVMRYVLLKGSRKEAIIKKNLNDEVVKKYGKNMVKAVLKDVREQLTKTFGYDLVEVPRSKFPQSGIQDSLYLVGTLRNPGFMQDLNSCGKDVGLHGFCMTVLSLIYCANNKIHERALFTQLQELDPHIDFYSRGGAREGEYDIKGELDGLGDVGEAMEKLKKEQYIMRERDADDEETGNRVYVYKMGPRAYIEVGRRRIVSFMSQIMGQETDKMMLKEIDQDEQKEAEKETAE